MQFDVVTLFPEMFQRAERLGYYQPGSQAGTVWSAHVESSRFHHGQLSNY